MTWLLLVAFMRAEKPPMVFTAQAAGERECYHWLHKAERLSSLGATIKTECKPL